MDTRKTHTCNLAPMVGGGYALDFYDERGRWAGRIVHKEPHFGLKQGDVVLLFAGAGFDKWTHNMDGWGKDNNSDH
jgi:hypothetical protein